MAAMFAVPAISCICRSCFHRKSISSSSSSFSSSVPSFPYLRVGRSSAALAASSRFLAIEKYQQTKRIRAVAGETLAPEGEPNEASPSEQPVSVPVSPSDMLTMFFKAEGTMDESAIPTVTKALEEQEGISDLKVQVLEGIASVELTKQTTVQATGVASTLVEMIQGSGFKLQTLNLSFEDEEDTKN